MDKGQKNWTEFDKLLGAEYLIKPLNIQFGLNTQKLSGMLNFMLSRVCNTGITSCSENSDKRR